MGAFPIEPLTGNAIHLCLDMQRLFWPGAPWGSEWVEKTLPSIVRIVAAAPHRTIFTRFIPAQSAELAHGMWRRYYRRWRELTLERIDPSLIELLPELAEFTPPARVLDKRTYSAFGNPELLRILHEMHATALIVTGVESDVCVLASILAAVDIGYRVIVVRDAICSSSDDGHDNITAIYERRYSEQIEVVEVEELLDAWRVHRTL